MLGLIGVGGTFLHRLRTEYTHVADDRRTLTEFHQCADRLNAFFHQLDLERNLALIAALTTEGERAFTAYRKQIAATDQTYAEFLVHVENIAIAFPRLLPPDRVQYIKDPFQKLIPECRAQALGREATAAKIMNAYARGLFNSIIILETFRARLHTPDAISFYDGLYTANKMREIEAMIASLYRAGSLGYTFKRDDLGIVRKQYFALTESETYLRRYFPELRTEFDRFLKMDADSVTYYKYVADMAGSMIDGPLPAFTLAKPINEYMDARYRGYLALLGTGFEMTSTRLGVAAAGKNRNTLILSAAIALVLIASLGVNLTVTRTTKSRLVAVSQTIGKAAEDVRAASEQLTEAGSQISQNASSNASSLEDVSAALHRITTVATANDDHIRKADALAKRANTSVSAGVSTVAELGAAMDSIESSGQSITQIIARINEISFQTNILALNAAVEAARAGAAGAGFSVVADEVRSLAKRCAEAAAETSRLIEESSRNTALAISKSGEVTTIFKEISGQVRDVGSIVSDISTNFHEQAEGISHVTESIGEQEGVAQSNAAIAEETAASALAMREQVESLSESVARMDILLGHQTRAQTEPARFSPERNDSTPADAQTSLAG